MILQEHAVVGAADTYKRGSLHLSKLGVKPLPTGERMKEQIKGKPLTEKKKHMDKIKLNELASIKTYLPQLPGCSLQLFPARRTYTVYYPGSIPGSRSKTWAWSSKPALPNRGSQNLLYTMGHHGPPSIQRDPPHPPTLQTNLK